MALTFCTFSRELKSAFNIRMNQTEYVNLLLAAIPVGEERLIINKTVAAGLMNGRKQVPPNIQSCLRNTNIDELKAYFETYVIQFVDESRRIEVMAHIIDLIPEDDFIPDQDKSLMIDHESNGDFSSLLAVAFTFAIIAENGNPDMFVHKAPALTSWVEMPDYSVYLKQIECAFSSIRTLLYYENPKPFYDFYVCNNIAMRPVFTVNLRLNRSNRYMFDPIPNATVPILGEFSNYLVITGTGGLGKSMMMRNLLLTSVSAFDEVGLIPVFIPLKDYNTEGIDLLEYIYSKFTDGKNRTIISREQFEDTLKHNRFILLLDGYDEIKSNCVAAFEKSLRTFIRKYPNDYYIVSSRPFEPHGIFERFIMLDLVPFSLDQSKTLIEKLEFRPDEPGIKQKFLQQLEESLYETHKEFASNPLLLTIMLMTFEQFAEVPSKMHVFYREAYATLSQKHDASKGAYKRALKTGLSADHFADYFSEFCARTYTDEKYEMSHKEIVDYFNKLNIRKKDGYPEFTAADFIFDLQNNLCLLYHESGKYHFTHRSFQEYFCALYFSHQKDKALERIGESFEHRKYSSLSDKTFNMLYDMIPEKVEEYIFLPFLQKMFGKCSNTNGYWYYLTKYLKEVVISPIERFRYDLLGEKMWGRNVLITMGESFIKDFLLLYVVKRRKGNSHIIFPKYPEFVTGEYSMIEYPNGRRRIVPTRYIETEQISLIDIDDEGAPMEVDRENPKITTEYEYHFPFTKIAKEKEKYQDLVQIFESDEFQPYLDYVVLFEYFKQLKAHVDAEEDDSLDFLG